MAVWIGWQPVASGAALERMAQAYVRGATQGDWEASARTARVRPVPPRDHEWLLRRIGEIGGALSVEDSPPAFDAEVEEGVKGTTAVDAEIAAALAVLQPNDSDETKWEKLWRLYLEVAGGARLINPQQRLVLKDVLDRHYGKSGQDKQEPLGLGIVAIPILGSGAGAIICPKCKYKLS